MHRLQSQDQSVDGMQVEAQMLNLCQQIDDPMPRVQALAQRWSVAMAQRDFQTACEVSEQLRSLAQGAANPRLRELAYYALGAALFCLGPQP